jgi:hypothetical protein
LKFWLHAGASVAWWHVSSFVCISLHPYYTQASSSPDKTRLQISYITFCKFNICFKPVCRMCVFIDRAKIRVYCQKHWHRYFMYFHSNVSDVKLVIVFNAIKSLNVTNTKSKCLEKGNRLKVIKHGRITKFQDFN